MQAPPTHRYSSGLPLHRQERPEFGYGAGDACILHRLDHRGDGLVGRGRLFLQTVMIRFENVRTAAHLGGVRIDGIDDSESLDGVVVRTLRHVCGASATEGAARAVTRRLMRFRVTQTSQQMT